MKKIVNFLNKNKRSIFYSFSIGLGLISSLQLLDDYGEKYFLIALLLTQFVLVFEIYLNWRYATKILRQIDMPNINVYNLWGNLLNHVFLPILLFFSTVGFVYFNNDILTRSIALFVITIIYIIMFINIRSYYEDEFSTESSTRYIFDVIKLFVFFFGVNLVSHLLTFLNIEVWIGSFIIAFLVITLGALLLYRKEQAALAQFIYLLVVAFVLASVFLILHSFGLLLLGINVICFLLFYFAFSILNHKLDRTLTAGILFEYVLVMIIAFILFFGIR